MKGLIFLISAIFSLTVLIASCKKQIVNPQDQLSLLPPATQTGANTFGCLVNGQAFTPQNRNIFEGPVLQCNYIYTAGGYYFTLLVGNKNNDNSVTGVNIETDSLAISEGQNIPLKIYSTGNAQGSYVVYYNSGSENAYETSEVVTGQLTITKLDTMKQIASGTFYFNAVNDKGDTVKITDGRFDMPYTR
jgi:hypothetical protein